MHDRTLSIGIDGCSGGWVALELTEHHYRIHIVDHIGELFKISYGEAPLLIDMPIGLPENLEENKHRPEPLVRKLLGKKASSIFNTPCRQAIYVDEYDQANNINRDYLEKGLSKQSFYIGKKIKEVDIFLKDHPSLKDKLLECHPELCFMMLNQNKTPLLSNKKTVEGMEERMDLLKSLYPKTTDIVDDISKHPNLIRIKVDLMDALVLAVTGLLSRDKGLSTIPQQAHMDSRGITMQMVYYNR